MSDWDEYGEYLNNYYEQQYQDHLDERLLEQYELGRIDPDLDSFPTSFPDDPPVTRTLREQIEALSTPAQDDLPHRILHLETSSGITVGQFFGKLLSTLWEENEGFSGKRPFGDSDWQYEVYEAMAKAGIVEMTFDEDGYVDEFTYEEEELADQLIQQAIKLMTDHG